MSVWTSRRLATVLILALLGVPARGDSFRWGDYAGNPDAWFAGPEAARMAENILSYQSDRGTWPKNVDTSKAPHTGDRSEIRGNFDNGATTGELRFLARIHRVTGRPLYREAFLKGLGHILAAQYPNGGWPQYDPPGPDYPRHITFNDDAMVRLLEFLREVARDDAYGFVDAPRRQAATRAFDAGIRCILACQVVVDGEPAVWCAQHDEVTLKPAKGRAYEHPSLSGGESAAILTLLMSLDDPSLEVRRAVHAGARWFARSRLSGIRVDKRDGDAVVVADPAAPPVWARFYEIGTNRPIFSGRDGVIRYSLAEIERERRGGYAWYGRRGEDVATRYRKWCARWGEVAFVLPPAPPAAEAQGAGKPDGPERRFSASIDFDRKGEEISPLLFGHNLEVTRRSVFGGLSAEMVSNRKFAAKEGSLPKRWKPISGGTTLAIDPAMPYAGRPSLRVSSDGHGGARQQVDFPLFPKQSWTRSILPDDYGSDVGGVLAFHGGRKYRFRWQLWTIAAPGRVWMRVSDPTGTRTIGEATTTLEPGKWQTWSGEFTAAETVPNARLEIGSRTADYLWIGAASIQPSDAFHGMRRDVIELLREIGCTALRFPGGCYSDFYRWQDGLLPVDERPPIHEGSLEFLLTDSDGYDTQELGIDEFIALCRELDCEPALTVRIWNKPWEPMEAVAWIEYCNGGPETRWGKLRAARGHADPYRVKTWFVGNELAFFGRNGMNRAEISVPRAGLFAEAMKKADPSLILVGCTDFTKDGKDQWNHGLMERAGAFLASGSYHAYVGDEKKPNDFRGMARASDKVAESCRVLATNIGKPVTLDEWNVFWGRHATIPTALHAASTLNGLCRDAKARGISQAYYFQPINEGAITVTPLEAKLDLAGKVFALYRVHQRARVLGTSVQAADPDIDLCASAAPDGKAVHVTLLNRNCDRSIPVSLTLAGFSPEFDAVLKQLTPRSFADGESELIEAEAALNVKRDGRVETVLPPGAIARIGFSARGL